MIPASMNKAINFLIMCFLNRLLIKVKWFPELNRGFKVMIF